MAIYVHLCAEVNGSLKDLLIEAETFAAEGGNPGDYFYADAKDVQLVGEVDIEPVAARHALPDTFGE